MVIISWDKILKKWGCYYVSYIIELNLSYKIRLLLKFLFLWLIIDHNNSFLLCPIWGQFFLHIDGWFEITSNNTFICLMTAILWYQNIRGPSDIWKNQRSWWETFGQSKALAGMDKLYKVVCTWTELNTRISQIDALF